MYDILIIHIQVRPLGVRFLTHTLSLPNFFVGAVVTGDLSVLFYILSCGLFRTLYFRINKSPNCVYFYLCIPGNVFFFFFFFFKTTG